MDKIGKCNKRVRRLAGGNFEEIKAEGRAEEIIENGMEYGVFDEDILNKLQRKLDISRQKAQEYFEMFGEQAV